MKIHLMKWLGLLLLTGMLAACGGGGKGNSTSATMGAIQAQLMVWQSRFATAVPLANDPILITLFDPHFLHDGATSTTYINNLNSIATSGVFPVGATFSIPVAVSPPDVGSVPNDATHQWFSTQLEGTNLTMLAIQNTSSTWLFAGNQRMFGVDAVPYAYLTNGTPSSGISLGLKLDPVGPNTLTSLLNLSVFASVSGPGLIGASGVAAPVTVFTSIAPASGVVGSQPILDCNLTITTNCLDRTSPALALVPSAYNFKITGTTTGLSGGPFTYYYNETVSARLPIPSLLASFPTLSQINGVGLFPHPTATGLAIHIGSNLSVHWTIPTSQIPQYVSMRGSASGVPSTQFYVNLPATSVGINSTTLNQMFSPASAVGNISVQISTTDPTTGMSYTSIDTY